MLFADVLFYLFLLIGLKLGNIINIRLFIFISLIIQYLSFALLIFFFKNPWLSIISMGLFNAGNAISNLTIIKNCWKYFKNNYGIVNGIILSGSGFSSSLIMILGEWIINGDKQKIYENGNFIKINIEDKLRIFLFIIAGIIIISGIFSFSFSYDYKDENEIVDESSENESSEYSQEVISDYSLSKRASFYKRKYSKHEVYNSLFSIQNLKLLYFAFFGLGK